MDFPIEKTVRARISVRTYKPKLLSPAHKKQLEDYFSSLANPFGVKTSFRFLEKDASDGVKLGTYGMIKGAREFIGATVADTERAPEALGYAFEKLILFAASLGLGTCWLGGTFRRTEFREVMGVSEGELFPAVSPIGYPTEKRRLAEALVRRAVGANSRMDWSKLFFQNGFDLPLTEEKAGAYALPLEMVRLGPSASNKQPWRIVRTDGAFHFYEAKTPGYGVLDGFDMQRLDLGIAACHFHLTALEKGLLGRFDFAAPNSTPPENTRYLFSWLEG